MKKIIIATISLLFIALLIGAYFFLEHKRKEEFGKSFNLMNEDYKQVLYATGQNNSQLRELMNNYISSWQIFNEEYNENPIKPYSKDSSWQASLKKIDNMVTDANSLINKGELKQAHMSLEGVRQEWQLIFERNNVTMLGFYLTQFHDEMELALEDSAKLEVICPKLTQYWQAVEDTKVDFGEDYLTKIKEERNNIDQFCKTPTKELGSKMKSGFISIYLKYG